MQISVEANIEAPVKKTWDTYTDAAHITKWNFATDEWHCPHAENDVRPGGKYFARMEAKDGTVGFDFEGTYTDVIPEKKLVYTIADGRKVEVDFEENNNTTNVKIVFDAESENGTDLQKQGWQAILNNFKRYTETK